MIISVLCRWKKVTLFNPYCCQWLDSCTSNKITFNGFNAFMFGALDTNKDRRVRFNVASRLQIPLVKKKTRYEGLSNTQYRLNGREE